MCGHPLGMWNVLRMGVLVAIWELECELLHRQELSVPYVSWAYTWSHM